MKIQDHYERLTSLYLRLNGFLTSNLIIHSDEHGNNKSELDHIAFRMPLHHQKDRNEPTSAFLELPNDRIQIIIGDSKSTHNAKEVRFNKGLRNDRTSIVKLLEWIGIFDIIDDELIDEVQSKLSQKIGNNIDGFNRLNFNTKVGNFQLTFIFFCPHLDEANQGELKYIHGQQMIDYCWKCLNKANQPPECNRTYSLTNWNDLELYVEYFKEIEEPETIASFTAKFES